MWTQLKVRLTNTAKRIWADRKIYGGIAAAIGAGQFGIVDPDSVMQVGIGCYVALVLRGGAQ